MDNGLVWYGKAEMTEKRPKEAKGGLTRAQERVLMALLSCATHRQAAAQAGVSERSLRRHLRDPEFHEEFLKRLREIVTAAVTLAQQRGPEAVTVLCDIMNDPYNPPTARLAAAGKILDVAIKGVETENLAQQVSELKEEVSHLRDLVRLLPPPPLEQPSNGHQRRSGYGS
jgi:hypothetical protein